MKCVRYDSHVYNLKLLEKESSINGTNLNYLKKNHQLREVEEKKQEEEQLIMGLCEHKNILQTTKCVGNQIYNEIFCSTKMKTIMNLYQ